MTMDGLLYINDNDVYIHYGAYLTEEREGEFSNYSALMKPPAMKPYTSVSFRENNGEKLPEKLTTAFEPRDVTLYFAITAISKTQFLKNYEAFIRMLGSGWLRVYLPELDKTYKMYYVSCSDYTQLTTFESGTVGARFKVKFREPNPTI